MALLHKLNVMAQFFHAKEKKCKKLFFPTNFRTFYSKGNSQRLTPKGRDSNKKNFTTPENKKSFLKNIEVNQLTAIKKRRKKNLTKR